MLERSVGTIVNGTFEIKREQHLAFIELVAPHLVKTRAQAQGCIYYDLARDALQDNLFHLIEGWSDRAALDAHLASKRLLDVRKQFAQFSLTNYRCTIFSVVDQQDYLP